VTWEPTDEQRRIIDHDPDGCARVLAGPGTGKSATVIQLLLRLAEHGGSKSRLLTFTRAATNELKEKVAQHAEVLDPPSTVHSFAISTLIANPDVTTLPRPIRIADDWEWQNLIREHFKDLLGCGVRIVDRARSEMASAWMSLDEDEDPDLPEEVRNRFAGEWEQHRLKFGYSLLSELPFRLLNALEDHADLQVGDFSFLVVDEYQDLNQCDLSLLKQLTYRGVSLMGVGDDDQSIYSFRRAHPTGIRRFLADDYPGASDYSLSISQRCATSVLEWARSVIEGLPGRGARPRLTPAPHCLPGEARYLQFRSGPREIAGVTRLVEWLIQSKGVAPEDIAVLYRGDNNRTWSGPLGEGLTGRGIPVIRPGEIDEILGESSNRRLLALARVAAHRADSLAWWTLLDQTSGIGNVVRDHFYDRACEERTTFAAQLLADHAAGYPSLAAGARARVSAVVTNALELLEDIQTEGADLGAAGWGTWLAGKADGLGGCEVRFKDLLIELDGFTDRGEGLGRFLGQLQRIGKDLRSGRAAGSVRLMTMGASKGLTVRAAIVVGVEDGIIPHPEADEAEERRLLYVAMTRSTEFLYVTWASNRTGPTARTGRPNVGRGRDRCRFLIHGSVRSEDGDTYVESLS